jgi:tetratricopeptide (TPR) repeat protein
MSVDSAGSNAKSSDQLMRPKAKPLIRKSIRNLFLVVLLGLAAVAGFWGKISLWRGMTKAEGLFQSYRDTDALQQLRKTLLEHGPRPEIALQLARAHRRLGDLQSAMLLAESACKLGANQESVALEKKMQAVQAGQIRGFEKEFAKLIMESGENGSDIFRSYILGLFANLRTEEAFSLLEGWQKSSPQDSLPRFLEAYLYHSIGRLPESITAYRQGLEIAPYLTAMRRQLAQVLFESGDFQTAVSELRICSQEDPKDIAVHVLMAQCAHAENDFGTALAELDRVLQDSPNHLLARRLRGMIQLESGDKNSALSDLEYVSSTDPRDLIAREAYARTLQLLGRSAEAKQQFEFVATATKEEAQTGRLIRQVLADPKNAELRFEIGMRLVKFGSAVDGVRWLRTVLEIEPDHAGALNALNKIGLAGMGASP